MSSSLAGRASNRNQILTAFDPVAGGCAYRAPGSVAPADATIGCVNYEMYMSAALAEAREAVRNGETLDGAVAVLDEALVARGHPQVVTTGDPTAHAVMVVLREAARRLGRSNLSGLIVFSAVEPCAMCVGALMEADVDGLVYATPDAKAGAAGSVTPGRMSVVSGIMAREAAELRVVAARGH